MEIQYIVEFLSLAETKSYSETADIQFVSPSSLSRHIQRLEEELGVLLFDRTTKKVSLTPYGETFLSYAKKFSQLNAECRDEIGEMREKMTERINVAVVPGHRIFPDVFMAFSDFQRENPSAIVNIVVADSVEIEAMLRDDRCDIGFIRCLEEENDEDLPRIVYNHDEMVIVVSKRNHLSNRKSVPLSELSDQRFITLKENTFNYRICTEECRKAGFNPKISYVAESITSRRIETERSTDVALLSRKNAELQYITDNMSIVELDPPIKVQLCFAYKKEGMSEPAERLVSFLQKRFG